MRSPRFLLACLLSSFAAFWGAPSYAQINPDQTLGAESPIVIPNVEIKGDLADVIEGGAIRGGNLFHSFSDFNVLELERVYFANPVGIDSILSRVTGNDLSNIFGTLGVDGTADLFLINPNGIIFGPNVNLDIEGSLYATTAEGISLGENVFSASKPEQSQLLSVSPSTSLLNYLTSSSGNIENRGQVFAGENVGLSANNLDLEGQITAGENVSLLAADAIKIRDTSENPFVAFASGDLLVQGNQQVDIVALSHRDSGLFSYGDMVIRSSSPVSGDAHYSNGGSFRVETLEGGLGDLHSPIDPVIRSLGDVSFGSYAGASLHILTAGSVTVPGTIVITGKDTSDFVVENVFVSNIDTSILIDGSLQPTLDIRAGMPVEEIGLPLGLSGVNGFFQSPGPPAFISSPAIGTVPTSGNIEIGGIFMFGPDASNGIILLKNNYADNGLDRNIQVGVVIANGEFGGFQGDSSRVIIDSGEDVNIIRGMDVSSAAGSGGDVSINAGGTVFVPGAGISTEVGPTALGSGGDVEIIANSIVLDNAAQIATSTQGQGQAGNILIIVSDFFIARQGSLLRSDTFGSGDAGDITIRGEKAAIIFDGLGVNVLGEQTSSGLFSFVRSAPSFGLRGTGRGGNISINTRSLSLTGGAQINADSLAEGNAGNIKIEVNEGVNVSGFFFSTANGRTSGLPSAITSQVRLETTDNEAAVQPTGNGGSIEIQANTVTLDNLAVIGTSTSGRGNAGSVFVHADDSISISNLSNIRSDVGPGGVGTGGDITIETNSLSLRDGGQVIAGLLSSRTLSGGIGSGGNIRIDAPDSVEISGTAKLDLAVADPLDPSQILVLLGEPSQLTTSAVEGTIGRSGDIAINTRSLNVEAGGVIRASALNSSNAGNILINANDTLSIDADSILQITNSEISTTSAQSAGGSIFARMGKVRLYGDSDIQSNVASGSENAGNITLVADSILAFDDSDIIASAAAGSGGNITLSTPAFFGENYLPDSQAPFEDNDRVDINATGRLSSGNIELPDVSIVENNVSELPDNLVNTESVVASSCIARSENSDGTLVVH